MIEACWPLGATEARQEQLNEGASSWLLDKGSLTARIKANCRDFQLALLTQGQGLLSPAEAATLALPRAVCQRQVCLQADGQPWVYGLSFWAGNEPRLASLGHNAMGELLFSEPGWQRGAIVPLVLDGAALPAGLAGDSSQLLGRASRFSHGRFHVWVMEVFLPQSPLYSDLK